MQSEKELGKWVEKRGSDDVFVTEARYALANLYDDRSLYDEAMKHTEECIRVFRKGYGADHDKTTQAINLKTNILRKMGNLSDAINNYEHLLEVAREGNNDQKVCAALNNLGLAYQEVGRNDDALKCMLEAVALHRKTSSDTQRLATTMLNIGQLYTNINQLDEGKKFLDEATKMMEQSSTAKEAATTDASQHPEVLKGLAMLNSGNILMMQENLDEALDHYTKCLDIFRRHLGEKNKMVGTVLTNMGDLLREQGKLCEARASHNKALKIMRSLEKQGAGCSASVANALAGLAAVFLTEKKAKEALELQEEALEIRMGMPHGEDDEKVAELYFNMAMSKTELRDLPGVILCYEKALDVYKRVPGCDAEVKQCKQMLDWFRRQRG